jgi:DNA-binding NarL/FixJ family response regulator
MAHADELISVAVVDDHPMIREGVASVLSRDGRFLVVAQGESGREAVSIACETKPDVMLIDVHMPDGGGIAAASAIQAKAPSVKTIMLTVSEEESDLVSALEAGASGYVLKGTPGSELIRIVRAVLDGDVYVAPGLAARAILRMREAQPAQKQRSDQISSLTKREGEILGSAAEGMTNKEIANRFDLSEKTVKHYMTNILDKLGVRNRVEAVLVMKRIGQRTT